MGLFRRHESCVGLLLFKWNQKTAELWYCPKGYIIAEHSHPDEDIELMYLMGSTSFYRRRPFGFKLADSITPCWWNIFKRFTVPAGWSHWFVVGKLPLIFINFATWRDGVKPTSASVDFKLTN